MSFFDIIEERVHRARKALRGHSGRQLFAQLTERIGNDAWQKSPHGNVSGLSRYDDGPSDPESTKALRFLLKCLEKTKLEHRRYRCDVYGCFTGSGHCHLCDGGLYLCEVCGQAEIELEAWCPGPCSVCRHDYAEHSLRGPGCPKFTR